MEAFPALLLSLPSCEVQVLGRDRGCSPRKPFSRVSQSAWEGKVGEGQYLSFHMHGSGKNAGRSHSW